MNWPTQPPIEVWRKTKIEGYEVSSHGNVRNSNTGTVLAKNFLNVNKNGVKIPKYLLVTFKVHGESKRFLVHRLVCEVFNGEPPSSKHEVAHYDGNSFNNFHENLRWATRKENIADKKRHGTQLQGEDHPLAKLSEEDVVKIRRMLMSGMKNCEIAEQFNVLPNCISRIKTGKRWKFSRKGQVA